MKKYLNCLLLAALVLGTAGMVTSCKDYDDDINNLESQVDQNKLALQQQLQDVASTAQQSANDNLQKISANTDLINDVKATAEQNGQNIAQAILDHNADVAAVKQAYADADAALETKIKAVDDAQDATLKTYGQNITDLTAARTALEGLTTKHSGEIAELQEKVNAIWGAITEVKIVGSNGSVDFYNYVNLTYYNDIVPANYDFGSAEKDDKGNTYSATPTISYVKGTKVHAGTDLIIRVNPVNATITADQIKLINSQGADLSEIISIDSVKPYEGDLVTRASNAGGLWRIYTTLKDDVTDEAWKVKAELNGQNIAYAVAVNNTKDNSDRYVISDYSLGLDQKKDQFPTNYAVSFAYNEFVEYEGNIIPLNDYYNSWQIKPYLKGRDGNNPNNRTHYDNTSNQSVTNSDVVSIDNGSTFKVYIQGINDAFYVALDQADATKDDYALFAKQNIIGINKVVKADQNHSKAEITVNVDKSLYGKEIGFRIFTVGKDGTVAPKNGSTFYVTVSAPKNEVTADANMILGSKLQDPYGYTYYVSEWKPVSSTLVGDMNNIINEVTNIAFGDNSGQVWGYFDFATDDKGTLATATTAAKDVKYIRLRVMNWNVKDWVDGKKLTFEKTVEGNHFSFTATKVMPTEATAAVKEYKWTEGKLVNNTYTAFVSPNDWKVAKADEASANIGYALTTRPNELDVIIPDAESTNYLWVNVSKDLLDGSTKHEAQFAQDFGSISNKGANNPWKVAFGEKFNIIFADPLDKAYQSAKRLNVESGVFDLTPTTATNVLDNITIDNTAWGQSDNGAWYIYRYYVKDNVKVSINSDAYTVKYTEDTDQGKGVITFTRTDKALPTADTAATLTITLTDAFGHVTTFEIPMTIKKAQ